MAVLRKEAHTIQFVGFFVSGTRVKSVLSAEQWVEILNCPGTIYGVLLINRMRTCPDHAGVFADLDNLRVDVGKGNDFYRLRDAQPPDLFYDIRCFQLTTFDFCGVYELGR